MGREHLEYGWETKRRWAGPDRLTQPSAQKEKKTNKAGKQRISKLTQQERDTVSAFEGGKEVGRDTKNRNVAEELN